MKGAVLQHRARRRYRVLATGKGSPSVGLVIIAVTASASSLRHEAARVALGQPTANGVELKHLSEVFRRNGSRSGRNRDRQTQKQKRVAYSRGLAAHAKAWGSMGQRRGASYRSEG